MDTEFHYWVTGLIALRSGFSREDAHVIAYSSEFIDENDVSMTIQNRKDKSKDYTNYISQTMNILKPKSELMRIYPIFHFIPGEPEAESAMRKDGKMHLLNTTPNSANAKDLISSAFQSSSDIRLYRIGIASHGYVDTWAHQNFVGWYDYFNNIGLDIKPDIGHADAEHHPDWIAHTWVDNRLVDPDINNKHRFMSAAKALCEHYCTYNKKTQQETTAVWQQLQGDLTDIMKKSFSGDFKRYADWRLSKFKSLTGFSEFDERLWFDDAIETDVNVLPDNQDGILSMFTIFKDKYYWKDDSKYQDTHWYKFQEAVKEHEKYAIKLLQPVFSRMNVSLGDS